MDQAGADERGKCGPEDDDTAVIVAISLETTGSLGYRRIAEVNMVMDLAGGMCAFMFRKLEHWIQTKHQEQYQPSGPNGSRGCHVMPLSTK